MKWKQSVKITRQDFASIEKAAETNMSWKNVRKVVAMTKTAIKYIQKNAEGSEALANIGSMKIVHTNSLIKATHQVKVKSTMLWQILQ